MAYPGPSHEGSLPEPSRGTVIPGGCLRGVCRNDPLPGYASEAAVYRADPGGMEPASLYIDHTGPVHACRLLRPGYQRSLRGPCHHPVQFHSPGDGNHPAAPLVDELAGNGKTNCTGAAFSCTVCCPGAPGGVPGTCSRIAACGGTSPLLRVLPRTNQGGGFAHRHP